MIFIPAKVTGLQDSRGMTLLEILLAMLVLTMVVSMVTLSLSGSVQAVNATREQGEIYYRAQVALQRISEDLASALLVEGVEFTGEDNDIAGRNAALLSFTSTAHIVFDPASDHPGIAIIGYTVRADEENEGELLLLRRDDLLTAGDLADPDADGAGSFLLSDRLRAVNFTYIDDAGEEHDTWSTFIEDGADPTDRKLPVAVQCTLEYWLDREDETSIEFSTGVLLPVGLINAQYDQKNP